MITEFQRKWLAALRSGKYKQCRDMLKDQNDNYCCLGVACIIMGVENEIDTDYETSDGRNRELYERIFDYVGQDIAQKGIEINDDGKSFIEIADELEFMYNNP